VNEEGTVGGKMWEGAVMCGTYRAGTLGIGTSCAGKCHARLGNFRRPVRPAKLTPSDSLVVLK